MDNQIGLTLDGLRPSQKDVVLGYKGGKMGISAVPGSGKTHTLSYLAADILLRGALDIDQEILVVTLVNSAVENFNQRIGSLVKRGGLLPGIGYRVRTLHGLAHDIVRERPGLVNLANDFAIIDESDALKILENVTQTWLRANPAFGESYIKSELNEAQQSRVRRQNFPWLVQGIAQNLIKFAKDNELTPDDLSRKLSHLPKSLPFVEMGCSIYQDYQRSLNYRGAVDFDDLIRLALAALAKDPALTQRLHQQWPYILEDEAQDSSQLQERIIRQLVGEDGHWVRVGDPNQAIYETFTTANPRHLMAFLKSENVQKKELPVSGRSTISIISLANHLVQWTQTEHPNPQAREALFQPFIRPTEPGDPQPNPSDENSQIYIHANKLSPAEEIRLVIRNLKRWQDQQDQLPEDQRETLAVLDLANKRGSEIADEMRKNGLDPVEFLGTTTPTRLTAGTLTHLLKYLADPQSSKFLVKAFIVWRRNDRKNDTLQPANKRAEELLRKLKNVEDFLYPFAENDWLDNLFAEQNDPEAERLLLDFRQVIRRWHGAALLPIDQAILTLAQDLFEDPSELAIAHKLAQVLRQVSNSRPSLHLPELSAELEGIAKNQRRFLGFSEDDSGFDPDRYRGQIVVTTMHKAKGLEWDRVYLLSVNNYDFPSGMPYDQYFAEKWYIQGSLNLEAEALEQFKTALSKDEYQWYEEEKATQEARTDTVRERLRLLYVGITRAKKSLIITWNSGRNGKQQASLPLLELFNHLEQTHQE